MDDFSAENPGGHVERLPCFAAKMDVGAWFATLTRRMKEIAKDLAFGCSTSDVAKKYGMTAGRISQLRRVLEESWLIFQQEAASTVA